MNPFNLRCCGQDPVYVDNVPGKEYLYCRECKTEVLEFLKVKDNHNHQHSWVYDLTLGFRGCQTCPAFEETIKATGFIA